MFYCFTCAAYILYMVDKIMQIIMSPNCGYLWKLGKIFQMLSIPTVILGPVFNLICQTKLLLTYIIFTTFTRPKSFSVVALTSFNISGASKDSVRRAWMTSGVEAMFLLKIILKELSMNRIVQSLILYKRNHDKNLTIKKIKGLSV